MINHQGVLRRLANLVKAGEKLGNQQAELMFEIADYIDQLEVNNRLANRLAVDNNTMSDLETRLSLLESRIKSMPTQIDIENMLMQSRHLSR